MVNMDDISPYLPVRPYFKETKPKNLFQSYGSLLGVDVTSSTTGQPEVLSWRTARCKKQYLCAAQPTLPLNNPNPVSADLFEAEPCMSGIQKETKELKHKYYSFRGFLTTLNDKRDNFGSQFKDDVETVKQKREILQKGIEDGELSEEEAENMEDDLLLGTGKSMIKFDQINEDMKDKELAPKTSNPLYSGGRLHYQPWKQTDGITAGVITYCTGPNLTSLCAIDLSMDDDLSSVKKYDITLEDTFYEIDTAVFSQQILCTSRHSSYVNMLKITKDEDSSVVIESLQKQTSDNPLSSVALNPYIEGEFITCTNKGVINLHKTGGSHTELTHCDHRFTCHEPYWECNWSMHPREFTLTDRTGVAVYDIRTPQPKVMDLFTLPHCIFNTKERLHVSHPHPTKSYYHVLGSNYSVVLADQRFPNHPVINWTHLMLSPPLYMDICSNVVTSPDCCHEDIVLLGTQSSCETHCFQLRTVNQPGTSPAFNSVPWRISPLSDMYSLVGIEGIVCDPAVINNRLKCPLVGVTALPHRQGFTALQLTSLGDVFQQRYSQDSYLKDKTCSYGPGSQDVKLSAGNFKLCSDWLKTAEELYLNSRIEVQGMELVKENIGDTFEKLTLTDDLSHIQCSFCKKCDVIPEEDHICVMCNTGVRTSKVVCDQIEQGVPVNYHGNGSTIDDCIESVQLDGYTDAYSDIILRLWNDKPIDQDILIQREEEWLARFGHKLKKLKHEFVEDVPEGENDDVIESVPAAATDIKDPTEQSLYSLLGVSSFIEPSVPDSECGTELSSDMLQVRTHIKVETSDIESNYSELKSESEIIRPSQTPMKRQHSDFTLPLEPAQKKKVISLSSRASPDRSSVSSRCASPSINSDYSYSPSVEGFGSTPHRLRVQSSQIKRHLLGQSSGLDAEFGIHYSEDEDKAAESQQTNISMISTNDSGSLFGAVSPNVLRKMTASKKKKKSVMGF